MSSIRATMLFLAIAVLSAGSALAQNWALPSKTPDTDVKCTGCQGTANGKMTAGWPGTAFKAFTGRFLDSQAVDNYQGYFRTGRAYRAFYAPSLHRIYMIIGSAIFAYDADRFFTRLESNEALVTEDYVPVDRPAMDRPYGSEVFLKYDAFFVSEYYPSGWVTPMTDGQQRMYFLDFDDQGYVYVATQFYGWGILKDPGTNTQQFMTSQFQYLPALPDDVGAVSMVAVVKSTSGSYYALVTENGATTNVFDVTDRQHPRRMSSVARTITNFAKNSAMTRIGVVNGNRNVEIYNTDDFISGRPPIYTSTSGGFRGIASDGTNFFATWASGAGTQVVTFAASGNSYTRMDPPAANFKSFIDSADVRYSDGYIVAGGNGDGSTTARVYKIENLVAKELDMTTSNNPAMNYISKYYTVGGGQYVRPSRMIVTDGLVIKKNSKTYFIIDAFGLGDVYELRAGDSVMVQPFGQGGTHNPKNPSTTTVYGDPLLFAARSTGTSALSINWDFGNPEAGAGADPNTSTSTTDVAVQHQFSGVSSTAALGTRTIHAANAASSDRSTDGTLDVVLTAPQVRFGVTGYNFLFTQPNASSAAPIVPEDRFFDASDGVLEGHWGTFTIQTPIGGAATSFNTAPVGGVYNDVPVGTCGEHTVSFVAHYGPYSNGASPTTLGAPLNLPASPLTVNYIVRPFAAGVTVVADPSSANLTFTNASKVSTTAMNSTQSAGLTYTWQVLDATGTPVALPAPVTGAYSSILPYVISKGAISRGYKVRLTLNASAGAGTAGDACSGPTQSVFDTAALNPPDPVVNGGCTNNGPPCSFNAGSLTAGLDQAADGWSYAWSTSPSTGVTATSANTSTFKPTFTVKGTYIVVLIATNKFGSATAQSLPIIINTVGSACPALVSGTNVDLSYGAPSGCSSGNNSSCQANENITFTASFMNYNLGCAPHTFTWDFGDNSTGSGQIATHSYSTSGQRLVKVTIDNGTQLTLSKTVTIGGGVVQPPNPPPYQPPPTGCATMSNSNVFIGVSGPQSQCTAATSGTCKTGETIAFRMETWQYNTGCASHSVSWSFGDGFTASGSTASHAYTSDGPHTVTMSVSNGSQNFQATQSVTTSGGAVVQPPQPPVQPPVGGCQTMNPGTNVFVAYVGPQTGCAQVPGGPACGVNEAVAFHVGTYGYSTSCATHTYSWNFGDNATSTSASPSHAYATDGTYHVTVKVANSAQSATLAQDVVVQGGNPIKTVSFDFSIMAMEGVANGYRFTATANPSDAITQWTWDYGDGEGATSGATHTHVFVDGKTYTIKLSSPQYPNLPPVTHTVPVNPPRRRSASH